MRKPYLAGNWKMNLDRRSATQLVTALHEHMGSRDDVEVAVIPPFVYIDEVAKLLVSSPIKVGAQDLCEHPRGAFTGEVSGAMLRDVGAELVVVGHSERRNIFGEEDELISAKLTAALEVGLEVILCVGERLDERKNGATEEVVKSQLTAGLSGVSSGDMSRITIAYEPVWAIGTGRNATPQQASEVHEYLRGLLSGLYDERVAEQTLIQYGGSVTSSNVGQLMAVEDVDGALVGGASLKPDSFIKIIDFDKQPTT